MKIKKYKLIERAGAGELEIEVNRLIKEGWVPQGGISINQFMFTSCGSPTAESTNAQAMVLFYEELDTKAVDALLGS